MLLWTLDAIFLVIAIIFLLGKGSFLIAGYNTLSKESKARYNEKRLCRILGVVMLCASLVLFLLALYDGDMPNAIAWLMPWGIIIPSIIAIVVANTKYVVIKDVTIQRSKKSMYIGVIVTCVIGIALTFLLFGGSVDITLHKEYLVADASFTSKQEIEYTTISDITYVEDYDVGSRSNGVGSFKLEVGKFKNDDLGRYRLYSYTSCSDYIILTTSQGMVVINQENEEKTKQLYQEIQNRIGE